MKNIKPVVDTEQVLSNIDQLLKEIREGLEPETLTPTERRGLSAELDKVAAEAYKCKLNLRIMELAETKPGASTREALLEILTTLPDDLSAEMLSVLAKHVAEQWKQKEELVSP